MSILLDVDIHEETVRELDPLQQFTLRKSVKLSGTGLFTGKKVSIKICPSDADSGIVFQRTDLPGKPQILASLENVLRTPRCTVLGDEEISIQTVEHLLATLKGYGIDNALIEISGEEVPIFDGSAKAFVDAIDDVGTQGQKATKPVYQLINPIFWSQGDIHLIALPSNEYRISYTLHYPSSDLLRAQYSSLIINEKTFKEEIAPCRTFCIYEEIAPLVEKGLIKGGGLENAVIIKEDRVLNAEGMRFNDEMARHKILDIIGDISLMGVNCLAHVIAIRSGHTSNIAFAEKCLKIIKPHRERL